MDIHICDSAEEATHKAADLIAKAVMFKPGLALGAATGHDFEAVYASLARSPVSLSWVRVVQTSEYMSLQPDDPRRARHQLHRSLIAPCGMQPFLAVLFDDQVTDPDVIVTQHRRRLAVSGGLDLLLLRAEPDGNLSSIEAEVLGRTKCTSKVTSSASTPPSIPSTLATLSQEDVMAAKSVVVLLSDARAASRLLPGVGVQSAVSGALGSLVNHPRLTIIAGGPAAPVLRGFRSCKMVRAASRQ